MDKTATTPAAEGARDGLPSMQFDGRRLLTDPEGRNWHDHHVVGERRLEQVERVCGQYRAAALAGVLSLVLLGLAWYPFDGALAGIARPSWWLPAVIAVGLAAPLGWWLARRRRVSPYGAGTWGWLAALWSVAALGLWGLAFGAVLALPWDERGALLLVGVALASALLTAAAAYWLGGLLLAWAALLAGQLLAMPDGLPQPLLLPVLGFDLILLALGMVLGQVTRQVARRTVAERLSRRELAQLKARISHQSERLSAESDQRRTVEQALAEARSAADVANRAKTEFLATMSHEVRTPLNGILPILEMLRETPLRPNQREFLDTAYNSSRHLLRIINDVLDFAKAESGKLELESIEIDLRELIESVTDLMGKSAEQRGLKLHYKVADDVPRRVRGDSIRLRQVLTNLVSNAIKFTDQGEIRIEVHKRRASRKEVELVFSVTDTGAGIARDAQRRLFRAFTQADASTTRKHGGTGLGLVICKRLVELMGGRIGVRSQPGKGATFWFVLPLRKSASDVPPARRDLTGLRVLSLVDDGETAAKLSGALRDWGLSEEPVTSAPGAVSKLKSSAQLGRSWSYDLLLVSMGGARQTFQALIDDLRNEPELVDLKILALTPSPQTQAELKRQPGVYALAAPLELTALQRQLQRLFDVEGPRFKSDEDTDALFDSLALDFEPRASGGIEHPVVRGEVVARALLVEDNPINLSVARRMLAKLGVDTEVARNGREALALLDQVQVDLVLMDCQMPEMDGYEATRRIREAEQHADPPRHLPIIAMTANAMTGDREQCLASGMDDYLGKPLEFTALRGALSPWVRLRPPGNGVRDARGLSYDGGSLRVTLDDTPSVAQAVAEPVVADAAIDADKLADLRELMADELPGLIRHYLDSAPDLIAELEMAAAEDDLAAMVRAAHALKSSSANLGALRLARHAETLEHAARRGDGDGARQAWEAVRADYPAASDALSAALA